MGSPLKSPGFRHKSLVNLALGHCFKEKCQQRCLPISHHQSSLICLPRTFLVSKLRQPPQAKNLGPNQRPSLTSKPHLPPAGCCPLALEIGAGTCRGLGARFPLPNPHDPHPPTPARAWYADAPVLGVLPPVLSLCHCFCFSSMSSWHFALDIPSVFAFLMIPPSLPSPPPPAPSLLILSPPAFLSLCLWPHF